MASATTVAPRFDFDPLRWLWRVLTSVRFALALIGFLALASLLGILIPQVPPAMRGNVVAIDAWYAFQVGRLGFAGEPVRVLGLFDVFRSPWFVSGLGLLVASVCVCTANRLGPVWRNVVHPQARVADDYFERGQPAVGLAVTDADALATELRRRRYAVSVRRDGSSTYLFADRFPWAQLATFVSHLALILFLAGGLVTLITAREQQLFIGEGEAAAPVFGTDEPGHMQLYVEDAVGRFDATGFPLDFRSELVVYREGREVARGVTTVNHPLAYGGYKLHQSAYFPDGAALRVREAATGRVLYEEVLALTDAAATPRIVVLDAAGRTVLDDLIVPTDFFGDVAGTPIVAAGRQLWVGARRATGGGTWQLVVFETGTPTGTRAILTEGERIAMGDLSLTFVGMTGVPSVAVERLPGSEAQAVAELSDGPAGKLLTVGPVLGQALALSPNQPVTVGGFEYTFLGQREFAGITVRRDPGSTFIWLATGVFLLGLALTFYTPRRRLWGKITADGALFRGLGGRSKAIERELREVATRAVRQGPAAQA